MSLEARNWARRIGGLTIAAKAVLMALADHADAEGKAWPKLKTLAEITSMTERHVRRQIGILEGRGLLVREDRFRKDGGQTSNVYRLAIERPAGGRESSGRNDDLRGPSRTAPTDREGRTSLSEQRTPLEPSSSDKEEGAGADDPDARATFDQAFEAWKAVSPGRLSRPRAWPIWRRLAQRLSPSRLLAAALRYLREDPDVKRYRSPQGLENWLLDEKFEAWAPKTSAAGIGVSSPSVPGALRDAAIARKGVAWVTSWIDPCRYDAATRLLHTRTQFAARVLSAELGALLRDLKIGLGPAISLNA